MLFISPTANLVRLAPKSSTGPLKNKQKKIKEKKKKWKLQKTMVTKKSSQNEMIKYTTLFIE